MKYDVFISYSSKDQKVVEAMCAYLEQHKVRCFVAYRDIPKGVVWARAIVEALDESKMMVVVFSEEFNMSDQVDREIEIASEDKKPILTFRISDTMFKGAKKYYLKNINWIDAFPDPENLFDSLLNNVNKLIGTSTLEKEIRKTDHKRLEQERIERERIETITVKGVPFTMIKVEGGTFQMGATSEQGSDVYDNEKPVHSVTLSDYYIGETEVTQELWQAVMGSNPSHFSGYPQRPVEYVSWNDCQEFITKLNNLTGKNFRLPTEAEWEYAARGGNKSQGYKYSGSNTIGDVAWYDCNSSSRTHDVKTKQANELGIYDMSGNVSEWCQDWYWCGSYSSNSQINPTGPSSGSCRVLRGGGWDGSARYCRVSNRSSIFPGYRDNSSGLRLVL